MPEVTDEALAALHRRAQVAEDQLENAVHTVQRVASLLAEIEPVPGSPYGHAVEQAQAACTAFLQSPEVTG